MIRQKITIGVDGMGRPRRVVNEAGHQYSRLTVIKLSRKRQGRSGALWVCRCSCGRLTTVGGAQLRIGQTKSCGCYRDEVVSSGCNKLPAGEASIRRAIGRAKHSAMRRNLAWDLTKEQALSIMVSLCHYCGCPPANTVKGVNGEFNWNGIDQKIAGAGYRVDNCVPCCITCNRLKSDTPYDVFVGRCIRIALTRVLDPQMRQVTIPLLAEFKAKIPILFDDIEPNAKQSDSMKRMR